jgi:hypothetical protein
MNDLDLRAALHRDADLVGEPSPDLLDQLVDRRRHQRRTRAAMITAAAVVVIAAAIPVGSSFFLRSEGSPATQSTTPTIESTPPATPSESPESAPQPSEAPETPVVETPVVETPVEPSDGEASSQEWPAAAEATHGGQYWAVFLAVARPGTEQAELQQAAADASALGYPAGVSDVGCSQGAHEQLGLDPTVQYQVVTIYFFERGEAQQFVDQYEPGVVGTAYVTAYCLD